MTSVSERRALTPMQQGMLFETLAAPESRVNIEQLEITVAEPLDVDAFESAWRLIAARHELMRTRFVWDGVDEPYRYVEPTEALPIERHDCRDATVADIDALIEADAARPFDLKVAPATRLNFLRIGESRWIVLWAFHHILIDGRTFTRLIDEVMKAYVALKDDLPPPEAEPAPSFECFVDWYRQRDFSDSRRFWAEQMAGLAAPTPLPWSLPAASGAPERTGVGEAIRHLPVEASAKLFEMTRRHVIGDSALVETLWALLLWRHTATTDVVFGHTRTGRQASVEGAARIPGLLINTLPKRVKIDPGASVLECMQAVRADTRASRAHQHLSLAEIRRLCDFPAGENLLNTLVMYDSVSPNDSIPQYTADGRWHFRLRQYTGYALSLIAYGGDHLRLGIEYDRTRIDDVTANALVDRLVIMATHLAEAGPEIALRDLAWQTPDDIEDHLHRWNDTARPPGPYACIYDAFAAQASANPDRLAVICGDDRVSYGELVAQIDALAVRLQQAGVARGDRVAVAVGRSERMIVATCAVQRVGAAYVPCDPRYPADRLQLMWTDARAGLILSERAVVDGLPASDLPTLVIDDGVPRTGQALQPVEITPDLPAHVIFTSGSTGRPKGVVVSHRNVMNFLDSMAERPGLTTDQRILAVTTLSFDIALAEIFLPLTVGAATVIADMDDVLDGARLAELIERHHIDVIQATPTTYRLLRMAGWTPPANCKAMVGGETLDPALSADLRASAGPGFVLWNLYGPTETTVYCSGDPVDDGPIHIGTQVANTLYYVVDTDNRLVAPGVAGELLIGGDCVALGYFDRPELTAERFIEAAVTPDAPTRRLYHSGDRVRWERLPDGGARLLFLGRLDNQIKLRGFRIELGEIEAVLSQHAAVSHAAVVLRKEGGDRLVAYVKIDGAATTNELRDYLADCLPSHMVPALFVVLDGLPMTENGKIDRNALPAPTEQRIETGNRYIAPRNASERAVAGIWQDVLGVHQLGIDDNFFDVGGDSLRIVAIRGRLEAEFGRQLSVAEVFQYATIRQLAQHLEAGPAAPVPAADNTTDTRAEKRRAALARRGRL